MTYKVVYHDVGDHAGWWKIFVKRWWGWKDTGTSCYKKEDIEPCLKRMEENPVRIIDGSTL